LLIVVALGAKDATVNQHLLLMSRCKNRDSWGSLESLLTQDASRRETVDSYNKAAVDLALERNGFDEDEGLTP
jgi:hypothetical protein